MARRSFWGSSRGLAGARQSFANVGDVLRKKKRDEIEDAIRNKQLEQESERIRMYGENLALDKQREARIAQAEKAERVREAQRSSAAGAFGSSLFPGEEDLRSAIGVPVGPLTQEDQLDLDETLRGLSKKKAAASAGFRAGYTIPDVMGALSPAEKKRYESEVLEEQFEKQFGPDSKEWKGRLVHGTTPPQGDQVRRHLVDRWGEDSSQVMWYDQHGQRLHPDESSGKSAKEIDIEARSSAIMDLTAKWIAVQNKRRRDEGKPPLSPDEETGVMNSVKESPAFYRSMWASPDKFGRLLSFILQNSPMEFATLDEDHELMQIDPSPPKGFLGIPGIELDTGDLFPSLDEKDEDEEE